MFLVIKGFAGLWERTLATAGKPSMQGVGTKMGTVPGVNPSGETFEIGAPAEFDARSNASAKADEATGFSPFRHTALTGFSGV
jgi:hypothetical protein